MRPTIAPDTAIDASTHHTSAVYPTLTCVPGTPITATARRNRGSTARIVSIEPVRWSVRALMIRPAAATPASINAGGIMPRYSDSKICAEFHC
jgi:hypothetical protein